MARREDDREGRRSPWLDRLVDALERDDGREVEKIRRELTDRQDVPLGEIERDAEKVTRRRADSARMLDRVRNVVQAIVLLRFLRQRQP
jgi:hypothetical protein